ncbi:MAG: FKBP-type peptidyl-prolyl cis-trans isomerase [Rhodothermaceae bacterium]|nr:FKBP-type peptidyl-prolyl cis-trans isomerase [Rhodothermaceae bacterium]
MTSKHYPIFILTALLLLSGLFTACSDGFTFRPPDFSLAPEPYDISNITPVTTPEGLAIYLVQPGEAYLGPVTERDRVLVRYTLRLDDGTIEDSSYRDRNPDPVQFSLGDVIRGFREGMVGMLEGEKRVIIVPPLLGYGNQPGHRLGSQVLRYDVELVAIID